MYRLVSSRVSITTTKSSMITLTCKCIISALFLSLYRMILELLLLGAAKQHSSRSRGHGKKQQEVLSRIVPSVTESMANQAELTILAIMPARQRQKSRQQGYLQQRKPRLMPSHLEDLLPQPRFGNQNSKNITISQANLESSQSMLQRSAQKVVFSALCFHLKLDTRVVILVEASPKLNTVQHIRLCRN